MTVQNALPIVFEEAAEIIMKHSTIGKPFEIQKRAEKLFESQIKDSWLIREQQPDFHIDYIIEIEDSGEPSGIKFAVQLKGVNRPNANWKPKASIRTKHLRYFSDKVKMPVFLVLVNVANGNAYWEFVQQLLKGEKMKSALQKGKTISITFNRDNLLSKFDHFGDSVRAAEIFVRNLWPGSPKAAITKRAEELGAKDKRLSVTVDLVDGNEHITFIPKSSFPVKFVVGNKKDKKTIQKIRDMIEYGEEVQTPAGTVVISGSPLFDEFNEEGKQGSLKMRAGMEKDIQICLRCPDNGKFPPIILEGKARAGTKGCIIECGSKNHIFNVTLKFAFADWRNAQPFDFNLRINPECWLGKKLRHLPYFEPLHRFLEVLKNNQELVFETLLDGNLVLAARLNDHTLKFPNEVLHLTQNLYNCREIAAHFSLDAVLPDTMKTFAQQLNVALRIDRFLRGEKLALVGDGTEISATMKANQGTYAVEKPLTEYVEFALKNWSMDFFDLKVPVGPVKCVFTNAKVAVQETGNSEKLVKWIGTKTSVFEIRAPDPHQFNAVSMTP